MEESIARSSGDQLEMGPRRPEKAQGVGEHLNAVAAMYLLELQS